jgi:hypothetical protein
MRRSRNSPDTATDQSLGIPEIFDTAHMGVVTRRDDHTSLTSIYSLWSVAGTTAVQSQARFAGRYWDACDVRLRACMGARGDHSTGQADLPKIDSQPASLVVTTVNVMAPVATGATQAPAFAGGAAANSCYFWNHKKSPQSRRLSNHRCRIRSQHCMDFRAVR